jgi:MoxR-like ATPase
MTRETLEETVLQAIAEAWDAAKRLPKPAWRRWEIEDWQLGIECGPKYGPALFGDLIQSNADRVRILRVVQKLEAAELVECFKSHPDFGKLARVRLTAKGLKVVKALKQETATK